MFFFSYGKRGIKVFDCIFSPVNVKARNQEIDCFGQYNETNFVRVNFDDDHYYTVSINWRVRLRRFKASQLCIFYKHDCT